MYTVTRDGKTFEQLEKQIKSLTFKDRWQVILYRVYPSNQILDDSWQELSGQLLYNRLRPFQLVEGRRVFSTKLPYQDIANELEDYKSELLSDLKKEFDFLQRQNDYKARFKKLPYWRSAADELSLFPGYNNPAILVKKIIEDDLEKELSQIESKNNEIAKEADFQARVDIMEQGQVVGRRVVATISQLNTDANINAIQLNAIYSNPHVQAIINLLLTGALNSAKFQIQKLDLTGLEPLNEEGRDRIIKMLDDATGSV